MGCSGTLIGPHHVLTAGHCLKRKEHGNWRHIVTGDDAAFDFSISQGDDGDSSKKPFGTCRWTYAYTVRGWFDSSKGDYDYAMVVLDPQSYVASRQYIVVPRVSS